jgi:hypothetical protein
MTIENEALQELVLENYLADIETEDMLIDEWIFKETGIFSDEDKVLVDQWLESRKGLFPNPFESLLKRVGKVEDESTRVLLTSMAPWEADLDEEFASMPEEVQEIFREKIVNLMRSPNFARGASVADLNFADIEAWNPMTWGPIRDQMFDFLNQEDIEHLRTGDWRETSMGILSEEFLYRGQNIHELTGPGFFDKHGASEDMTKEEILKLAAENKKEIHDEWNRLGVKPFEGDLPSYYMGIKDPGEYFEEVTFLPKKFSFFDMDKPVYDISEHFNFIEFPFYDGIDSEEVRFDDGYIVEHDRGALPDILNDLQQLKTGKEPAINLDSGDSFLGKIKFNESIDLGTYTQSLGYDHDKEMFYFSATDIWDFTQGEQGLSKYGKISPHLGEVGNPVQLYGRTYISEEDLLGKIILHDKDYNYNDTGYRGTRAIDIIGSLDTNINYYGDWDNARKLIDPRIDYDDINILE